MSVGEPARLGSSEKYFLVSVNFTSNVSRSFMSRLYVANKTEEPSFCTIRRFYLFLFLELINSPQLH